MTLASPMVADRRNGKALLVDQHGRAIRPERVRASYGSYDVSRFSQSRSFVYAPVQDADRDLDGYTRWQMLKYCRHLYRNSPFIRGLIERLVTYTVGTGLHPVPVSSDPKWNARAMRGFAAWSRLPCVNTRWTFGQYQRVTQRSKFLDGEMFSYKTYGESGRARIQALPSHRIRGDNGGGLAPLMNADDGIDYDKTGRPISYKVSVDPEGKTLRPVPADLVVHHLSPFLPGSKRGEPLLASAVNWARDVDDIIVIEKAAVKSHGLTSEVVKTATGELEEEQLLIKGAGTSQDPTNFYKKMFGPDVRVLRHGDEFDLVASQRPSPAWSGFIEFLTQTICLSANIPPSVLLQIKVGGADTRRDLAAAQRTFELWQADLSGELQGIWEYWAESEIEDGSLVDPPDDWRLVEWQCPKAMTVDDGRERQADRQDVAAGLMTRREYWGRYGLNPDDQEDTIVREAVRRRDQLKKAGLSLAEFVQLMTLDPKLFAAKLSEEPPAPAPVEE